MTQRVSAILIAPLIALCFLLLGAAPPTVDPPAGGDPLAQAEALLKRHLYQQALTELTKLDQAAEGRCGACLVGEARAFSGLHQWSAAADAARRAIPLLTAPAQAAEAYNQLGVALVAAGRDKGRLAEAEQAFRKAIELGGSEQDLAPYNLAAALSQEERFAEAAETARSYLKSAPTGAAATPARVLICGLRREGKIAPPEWASSSPVKLPPPGKATEARGPSDQSPVSRPVKLSGPQPPAPAKLEKQGTVIIDSIIDEEGCVVRSRVLESLTPELDQISLDTLRFWVFQPATFQGKPVKVYYTLTVNYRKGR